MADGRRGREKAKQMGAEMKQARRASGQNSRKVEKRKDMNVAGQQGRAEGKKVRGVEV